MAMDENFRRQLEEGGADVEGTLKRFMGNDGIYLKFLGKFPNDPNYANLGINMESANYEEAYKCAHALKGVVGNLGLTPIFENVSALVEEHTAQIPEPLEALLLVHLPLTGEKLVQGNTLHEILHDVDIFLRFKDVHDPGQHGMLKPLEDIGLRQEIKPGGLIFADLLHRPAGMKADMLRQIDGRHTAFANHA